MRANHDVVQDHEFFEPWCEMLRACHLAHSTGMFDLLVESMGKEMDKHMKTDNKLKTFWNEYCVGRWACWSIAHSAAATPKHTTTCIMLPQRKSVHINMYHAQSAQISAYQHVSVNVQCDLMHV